MLRNRIKAVMESGLVGSGISTLRRSGRRGQTLVLAYHDVVPHGEPACGDRSLHLPQEVFAAQLDLLCATHDVVPLGEIFRSSASGRPRAVITFDDAYRGAVTAGVEELARRDLPATIFVAPAFLGGRDFWWDVMVGCGERELDASFRMRALDQLGGRDERIRAWAERAGCTIHPIPPSATAADLEEVRAAARQAGITLGSHTWSHPNLTSLGPDELAWELRRPLDWLRERFVDVIPWLAYPYGLVSESVARAAAGAGYEGALRVEGGWMPRGGADPYRIPRLNVPAGLSLSGFALRTSGLFCG